VALIMAALADAVIEAREGVSLRNTGKDDDVSMSDAMSAKSLLEQSETKDEETEKTEKEKKEKAEPQVKPKKEGE